MLSSSCTTMASVTVTSRLKTALWTAAHSVSRCKRPSAATHMSQCCQLFWQSGGNAHGFMVSGWTMPVSTQFVQNFSDASSQHVHGTRRQLVLPRFQVAYLNTSSVGNPAWHSCVLRSPWYWLPCTDRLLLQTCYCSFVTAAFSLQTCHCRLVTAGS